jgi:HAD superfamily hydrolase (TIGR01490 family)
MTLALFDLDHTLLSADSDSAWWQFLFDNKIVDVALYQEKVTEFNRQYHQGKMDIEAYFTMVARCLAEFELGELLKLREQYLADYIQPMMQQKALQLVEDHRQQGDTLILITATHDFIANPIAELFNIQHVLSSKLAYNASGFTGQIADKPCYQEGKIWHLLRWLNHDDSALADAYFYSDSQNDLPLLKQVARPVAVDPDAVLNDYAVEQGWPIISLRD